MRQRKRLPHDFVLLLSQPESILVSTPHNTPLIMGGRHNFFEDPMLSGWDISKTKSCGRRFRCLTLYNRKLTVRGSATARLNECETKRHRFSHWQVQNECGFIVSDTLSWVACFITASSGISGDRSPLLKPQIGWTLTLTVNSVFLSWLSRNTYFLINDFSISGPIVDQIIVCLY